MAATQAEAMKTSLGGGSEGGLGTTGTTGAGVPGSPKGQGSSQAQWENAMARVLMMEQKAFFAQRPRMDPGRNLQPLPDVLAKKSSTVAAVEPRKPR